MDDGRSMRAVKDGLPTPSGESEESKDLRWIRAVWGFSQAALLRSSEEK
jgi:hypothetical protein